MSDRQLWESAAFRLKTELERELLENSGLEQRREYLGMSAIGRCPRALYQQYVNGRSQMTIRHHYFCWVGYLFEDALAGLFGERLQARGVEVVADFDDRFRGHVDFVTVESDPVEVKSVSWHKFKAVRSGGPTPPHWSQMQMYLHHGGWARGFIVYVARDALWKELGTLPLRVFEVRPSQPLVEQLNDKARRVLAAVDAGRPPVCECGYCR